MFFTFSYSRANVYNCTSSNSKALPQFIYNDTDVFILRHANITYLCDTFEHFSSVSHLNLRHNGISSVCESFANQLDMLLNMQKIWLSGNPYHCDCDMTWMIQWLNTFTTPSGEHIIADFRHLKCHSGMMMGKPIHKLNDVEMGCFSLTKWQKIVIAVSAGVAMFIIFILVAIVLKKSREASFFIFHNLKIRSVLYWNEEKREENLDDMKYDAYLTYR